MTGFSYDQLLDIIADNVENSDNNRYFIALSGPLASGKSTISERFISDLNAKGYQSSVLQMDGFHYDDQF